MPTPSPERDKFGRDYASLLQTQKVELKQWGKVLRPEVFSALTEWCEMVNGPAEVQPRSSQYRAGGLHSCPVGCEIPQFLLNYGKRSLTVTDLEIL
jgi:hypothetical protein